VEIEKVKIQQVKVVKVNDEQVKTVMRYTEKLKSSKALLGYGVNLKGRLMDFFITRPLPAS
jgi:hypothetical protein